MKVPQLSKKAAAPRAPQPKSGPRPWTGLRDPRIVRVSRSLGGKDRHSKVSTIRGLRDRRVRLSVSTALQLYDLQDKLGLSQPSKAVDWLLNAAQHEIDKLPPLQFPPGSFIQCPPSIAAPHGIDLHEPISDPATAEEMELMKESESGSLTLLPRAHNMGEQTGVQVSTQWSSELSLRERWKENTRAAMEEKDGFLRRLKEQEHHGEQVHSPVAPVHPSMSSMTVNNDSYASYYYNLEGTNICLARVGDYVMSHAEENGNCSQQLLLCRSAMPPLTFSSYAAAPSANHDPKHVKGFHLGSS